MDAIHTGIQYRMIAFIIAFLFSFCVYFSSLSIRNDGKRENEIIKKRPLTIKPVGECDS